MKLLTPQLFGMKNAMEIDNIFYASWGYDQTNIDFAQIVELSPTGKTALCRMMSQNMETKEGYSPMSEFVKPDKPHGETFRLKVSGNCLRGSYPFCGNNSKRFGIFSKWEGKRLYQSHYA